MNDYAKPIRAGLTAAVMSGAPSTAFTLVEGGDLRVSTRAVSSIASDDPARQLLVGAGAHLAISLGWAAVLARLLPRRHPIIEGVLAGAGIAALDLGLIGRRLPVIRGLPQGRQWADHLAYGVTVTLVLGRRDGG